MSLLYHLPLDVACRAVRLAFAEGKQTLDLEELPTWEQRQEFKDLNPAQSVPIAKVDGGTVLVGASAALGYLTDTDDEVGKLLGSDATTRADVRRLVDWALLLFTHDVVQPLVHEKAHKRRIPEELGGGAPDSSLLRIARDNWSWHRDYLGFLLAKSDWVAGESMTLADLAFAAAVSSLDYLGEIRWNEAEPLKPWYARMKSRPCMASLLEDRVKGVLPPPHYDDPDF